MEDIKKTDAAAAVPQSEKDTLKAKYGKVFRVSCSVREDEDSDALEFGYYFKRPSVPSYDRYLKGVQQFGMTRASKTFLLGLRGGRGQGPPDLRDGGISRRGPDHRGQAHGDPGPDQRSKFEKALRERAEEVRSSLVEAGLLEIYRFLPPPLLEGFDPEKAEIGEFLGCIAKARYVQELEKNIIARAISEVFGGE